MRPAVPTSFDVAIWFLERARAEDSHLQPRKLQCLLFLAQAHFAVANAGCKLMPSVFVFDHAGPMDSNIYRALEFGRPNFTETPLPDKVTGFLAALWQRYGAREAEDLYRLILEQGENELAVKQCDGSEIGIDAMQRMFAEARQPAASPERPAPELPAPELPAPEWPAPELPQTRFMVSPTGRHVTVEKWVPGVKPAVKSPGSG
jgi:uncharacterized phage-associated protein